MYNQVVKAMKTACEDMCRFSGERAKPINAEYLFTIAVAKQIDKLNSYYGDPYRIYLEKSRKELSKDCLLPVKFGNPRKKGSTVFRDNKPQIDNKERADIAVYEDVTNNNYIGYQPICVIEVKGFNPLRKLVVKDLKRNLEYFNITGKTGNSIIKSTLFAALYSWEKIKSEDGEPQKILDLKQRYTSWLSELGNLSHLDVKVTAHSVSIDSQGEVTDEGEYEMLNTDTIHHFVGVIVEFRAKKI